MKLQAVIRVFLQNTQRRGILCYRSLDQNQTARIRSGKETEEAAAGTVAGTVTPWPENPGPRQRA